MSGNRIIGGVEIGTAKTVVLIGEIMDQGQLTIIGMGESKSEGIRRGAVIDYQLASAAVHEAIQKAEKSAKVNLESIYLAQTGGDIEGFLNAGSVRVAASDNCVSESDIERVEEEAKGKELPEGRVYIHHIENPFFLDGRPVKNPLGMEGHVLQKNYWSIHADRKKVRDRIHIVNGFGLSVKDVVFSGLAFGNIVSSEGDKESGVIVIDVGCGTTDYVYFKDGYVVNTGVIPVGGSHLTNDLSLALHVSYDEAERLKLKVGIHRNQMLEHKFNQSNEAIVLSHGRRVNENDVKMVLEVRLEEIFELVKERINDFVASEVVLTGGGVHMRGIEALCSRVLALDVRIGRNPEWAHGKLKNPEYSTVLGLLHHALISDREGIILKRENKVPAGIFRKLSEVLADR